jgi:Cu+-exporting ATPase
MFKDPVCQRTLTEEQAAGCTIYAGRSYFFCTWACQHRFEHNPAEYIEEQLAA